MKPVCVAGTSTQAPVNKDQSIAVEAIAVIMAFALLVPTVCQSVYHTQKMAIPVAAAYHPLLVMSVTQQPIIVHHRSYRCRVHPVFALHFAWATMIAKGLRARA